MTPSHPTQLSPIDYVLAVALNYVGLQIRAVGVLARDHVAGGYALLVEALDHRGIVTTRAAALATRALLYALDEVAATNATVLARQLARAEALATFRRLLDGDAPTHPPSALSAAWSAWRRAPGVDESLALAHAALHVGARYADGTTWTIGDLTGQRLARELGRSDLLGEAEGPGPVRAASSTDAPTSGDLRRAPRFRLEVV